MLKDSIATIGTTARDFLRNSHAMIVFHTLYAVLLAMLYLFISTKEASIWQLTLTATLAVIMPVLFFLIQAASVSYTQTGMRIGSLLRKALKSFWKLFLVSIPFILLALLVAYLLTKMQVRFPAPSETVRPSLTPVYPPAPPAPAPLRWSNVFFSSMWLLLLGIFIPLVAIHFWISIAREGFRVTLKRGFHVLLQALQPQSLLIYAIGLIAFALMPYFLIFTRTPVSSSWLELLLFGIRLALAFISTLWGWVITVGALTKNADVSSIEVNEVEIKQD